MGDRTISANRPSRRSKKVKGYGEDEMGEEEWDVDSEEDIIDEEEDYAPELDPTHPDYVAPAPRPKPKPKKPAAPRPRPKPKPKPKPVDVLPEFDFDEYGDGDAGGELGTRRARSRKINYKDLDVDDDMEDDDYDARGDDMDADAGFGRKVSRKPSMSIKLPIKAAGSMQRQPSRSGRVARKRSASLDDDDEDWDDDMEYKPQRTTSRRAASRQQSFDYELIDWDAELKPKKSKSLNPYVPLNKVIKGFLEKARVEGEKFKKMGYDTYYFTFYSPVPKGYYLDYNVYVPKEQEICLQTIKGKADKNKYRSLDEFMENIRRIAENARLYHTQGEKRVAHVPELGEGLVNFMQEEVDKVLKAHPELAGPFEVDGGGGGVGGGISSAPSLNISLSLPRPAPHVAPTVDPNNLPEFEM